MVAKTIMVLPNHQHALKIGTELDPETSENLDILMRCLPKKISWKPLPFRQVEMGARKHAVNAKGGMEVNFLSFFALTLGSHLSLSLSLALSLSLSLCACVRARLSQSPRGGVKKTLTCLKSTPGRPTHNHSL
jgi:hypothetical protein